MNIVTSEVQTDQALEDNTPSREGRRKEDEQTRRCASIGDHVENRAEGRGLVVVPRG